MNASDKTQCRNQLNQVLTQQIQQVSSYVNYLGDIKTAISVNDTNELNELLERQQNPEHIENTQVQQAKILTAHGFESSDQGLNQCIADCDLNSQLKNHKNNLTEKLKELEKSLLINALLVQKSQHRVKQSIRLLSGHDPSGTASSYSKLGNIENHEESKHSLAQV